MRRAKPGGWYDDFRYRLRFERAARTEFPSMSASRAGKGRKTGSVVYTLHVPVPELNERRLIRIALWNDRRATVQSVTADGLIESPHRYSSGALCMWYPKDGSEQRWVAEDGLLRLIRCTQVHLFKEAFWRRYGEWPGPEAPHGPDEAKETA
jgi:hypothetical protein